jgi:peptide/nickel transport system permease protein
VLGGVTLMLIALACLAAPLLTQADPLRVDLGARLLPSSPAHPLGTDHLGRDILSRLLHGGRVSLALASIATVTALGISMTAGGLAGYVGGRLDGVLMRVVDLMLAFPRLVLAIVIAGLLGVGIASVLIAVVAVSWAGYARIVRGSVLQAREEPYVLAAHALGASPLRILVRHVLPSIAGPIVVLATLDFGRLILQISSLSFLGIGIRPPAPEWGAMLTDGRLYFARNPELMLPPGLAIFATVLAANLLGDAARDALDPRRVER